MVTDSRPWRTLSSTEKAQAAQMFASGASVEAIMAMLCVDAFALFDVGDDRLNKAVRDVLVQDLENEADQRRVAKR